MAYIIQAIIICLAGVTLSAAETKCANNVPCIRLDQCTGFNQQLKNRNEHILNLLKKLHCGFEGENEKVCCPDEYRIPFTTPKPSQEDLLPSSKVCGIQNSDRIVGGSQTAIDEHPWMALLRYDKPTGHGFYCGGVIISKRYILTAAHCVKGNDLPKTWKLSQVRLGEWDLKSVIDCQKDDCGPEVVDIPVEEAIAHENYRPSDANQHNDIALVRLARDVNFTTDFVRPICLPTTPELKSPSFDKYRIEVAGWGKTETRSTSDVKLKVLLPMVDHRTCQDIYKKANRVINNNQLCAGGQEGKDSCRGDSGGPLMGQGSDTSKSETWVVFGVVSYGPSPCGSQGWPGVYTKVASYIDWIKSKIRA